MRVNESLEHAERTLLLPDGLPHREWYRHQIYAPGLYTGYGVKTLPGVREAVGREAMGRSESAGSAGGAGAAGDVRAGGRSDAAAQAGRRVILRV